MDALTHKIHTLLENGFAATANVAYQSASSEIWKQNSREIHPSKRFYVVQVESEIGMAQGQSFTFEQAYTLDNKYIGSVEDAEAICCKHKISPEYASANHGVCSVGQAEDGKWFGWSHRALSSFDSRDEAVQFAESVSNTTIEEASDHVTNSISQSPTMAEAFGGIFDDIFKSHSARNVNVVQCVWFRYNGTRRVGLKTADGDKFMVEQGDIFGIRYDQRKDLLTVYSNTELDLPFLADVKTIERLVDSSKPYRGKVDGKTIPSQKDWLVPAQRKAYDRKHVQAPKVPKATKEPKAPKAPKAASNDSVKVVPEQALIAKSKPAKMKAYSWFKVVGKIPRMKCMDKGDLIEIDFESGDVIGLRYVADTNEIVMVLNEDNSFQCPVTLAKLRNVLKSVSAWSGQVNQLSGRASRGEATAQAKYWMSREFTSLVNAGIREEKANVKINKERAFIESVDVDEGGRAISKKASAEIESALNSGATTWFAAGVTNTARDKANVVFADSKAECIKRLTPLMRGNAAADITTGIVSKAHGIYREYLDSGERKFGLTMHSGRIQPLIRDAVSNSVSSSKSGNITDQEVVIPEFNENIASESVDKAPVFKGNDVEVLLQISNLVASRKAFTAAYSPLPKLKRIRIGECLLLKAKHNNERYRVEGTRAVNRMRKFFGSNAISGAFKENDGQLFLVVYLAVTKVKSHNGTLVNFTDKIKERALRIRRFMTNSNEQSLERQQDESVKYKNGMVRVREDEAKLKELMSALDTIQGALDKRRAKLEVATLNGGNTEQHTAKIEEYTVTLREVKTKIKTLEKGIKSTVETLERSAGLRKEERNVSSSVYTTSEGEQVVIVRANYPAGELIVSPIKGSKANYDRQIAVHELFDLGGNKVM